MLKIMGIDQSLNSSGKVIMTLDEDKNLDIVDMQYYGYHQTKKRCFETDKIHIRHLPKGWTKIGLIHRLSWITNYLLEDTDGVKYMSMEDLAYGKLKQKNCDTNSILQLAQIAGSLKVSAFDRGIGVIAYNIDQNKNFATGDGKGGQTCHVSGLGGNVPPMVSRKVQGQLPIASERYRRRILALRSPKMPHQVRPWVRTGRYDQGSPRIFHQ